MNSLDRLIAALAKLPGLGRKSAARLAYYLLRADPSYVRALAADLIALRERIRPCAICGAYTEVERCDICADPSRETNRVCVVEQPQDVATIEATGEFRGRYHVLMGVLSPLDGVGPEDLRIDQLLRRVPEEAVQEVIVATNPTVEGEATAAHRGRRGYGAAAGQATQAAWGGNLATRPRSAGGQRPGILRSAHRKPGLARARPPRLGVLAPYILSIRMEHFPDGIGSVLRRPSRSTLMVR